MRRKTESPKFLLLLVIVAALVGALVVAGCGGGSSSSSEAPTTEEAVETGGAGEEEAEAEEPAEEEEAETGGAEAEEPAEEEAETGGAEAGGESAAVAAGKTVFTTNCGSCHTLKEAGTSGEVGPNLDELEPDLATVEKQVENGGGGMPPFKGTLSPEEITDVATFVSTVAGTE
ncbi:MAG TPA: cytochrome c [Solirubrobacterales bacterium]|nr:cytochrome c [Solirubrobacterales bacterium]